MKFIRMIDEETAMQFAVAECNCRFQDYREAFEESIATGAINAPKWDGPRPYGAVRVSDFLRVYQMTPIDPWRVKIDSSFTIPESTFSAGSTTIYEETVLNPFPAEICRRAETELSAYLAELRNEGHYALPPYNGLKRDEVTNWVTLSYRMGINPLPALRKRYENLGWARTLKYEAGVLYITG